MRGCCLVSAGMILLLTGCSGSSNGGPDADAPDGPSDAEAEGTFEPTPPQPPATPEPVVLTPCPEGWVEVPPDDPNDIVTCEPWPPGDPVLPPVLTPCSEGWREVTDAEIGTVTCDPWPEGGSSACEGDQVQFPGEPRCRRLGTACPAGDWPEGLPGGPVLYVRAGGAAGGVGSLSSPFGTIAEAVAVSLPGTVVALSKGRFAEAVVLPSGVTLWGACVAETVVASPVPSETEGTISTVCGGTGVRNLTVGGDRVGVIVRGTAASMDVVDVVVSGTIARGLMVPEGGTLTATGLVVRDTRPRESDEAGGGGLEASGGAAVHVTRGLFERNRYAGLAAFDAGTSLALEDVVVRDTGSQESDRDFGWGLSVQTAAAAEVTRALFEANTQTGVGVDGPEAAIDMTDVVVRGTLGSEPDGQYGVGLLVRAGAQATLARASLLRNRAAAIQVAGENSVLDAVSVVARDTDSQESDGRYGVGLSVLDAGQATVHSGLFERNRAVGIEARGSTTSLVLWDVVVRDTEPQTMPDPDSGDRFGRGLNVSEQAQVQIDRVLVQGNHDVGVVVGGVGTEAGLRHVAVRDTRAREADGMLGRGLHVQQGARVDVQHAFFDANHEVGVAVSDAGTRLRLSDCTIRDTVGQEADGQYGRGLAAGGGAAVELLRVAVERSREMGISVADEHTTLVGTDLTVRDTLGEIEAAQAKWGRGLAVQRGPEVRIVRGLFERNREACLFVAGADTALVLEDVTVRDTLGRASDDRFGRGLVARAGATCTVARGLFERNREVGVAAAEEGTTVTLEDVTVRDTLEASCADAGCIDAGAGTGVGSYGGAWVGARRFLLTGNAFCGIQLAHGLDEHGARAALGGTADLSEGEVSYNAVCGANVQTEGFDVARLMDDVLYHHNGLNLDMSELPVPDPGASLPEE